MASPFNICHAKPKSEFPTVHKTGQNASPNQAPRDSSFKLDRSSSSTVDVKISFDTSPEYKVKVTLKQHVLRFMKTTNYLEKIEKDLSDEEIQIQDAEKYQGMLCLKHTGVKSFERDMKIKKVEEIFNKHVSNIVEKQYPLKHSDLQKFEKIMGREDIHQFYCTYHFQSLTVYCERTAQEAVIEKIERCLRQISGNHESEAGSDYMSVGKISKVLSAEICGLLKEYPEARDFLLARLQRIGCIIEFFLEEKLLKFTGEAKSLKEADTFWKQIIFKEHNLSDQTLRVISPEEVVTTFQERMKETHHEIFVSSNLEKESLLLVDVGYTKADLTAQMNAILDSFGHYFLELGKRKFYFLAKNDWDIAKKLTQGKQVEFTPQHEDKTYGLLLRGSKVGIELVCKQIEEYVENSCLKIDLSDQELLLLQNPQSKQYVEEEAKSCGVDVEINYEERIVSLLWTSEMHAEVGKWFRDLFTSGHLKKEDIPEMLPIDELKTLIESTPEIQGMFVLDSEGRWTGIKVFKQNVCNLLQELQSNYFKCEDRLVLTKTLNELLNDKDKKFLGERRHEVQRVKCHQILEEKQHLLLLAGPKIEVALFKELLLRANEEPKIETVKTQPVASAESQTSDAKERKEGNDSNSQGSSEEIEETATANETETESTISVGRLLKEETFDLSSQDVKLLPSEVCHLLSRLNIEITEYISTYPNDSNLTLRVTGTKRVLVVVIKEIEAILKEHKETEIVIFLTSEERKMLSIDAENKKVHVHLGNKQIVFCGPRKHVEECLSSFFNHIKEVSYRQTQHSPFSMKSCEEKASEFVIRALEGNKYLKDQVASKFFDEGYHWKMTKNQTIVLHAGSFPALEKARRLFRDLIQEMSFHMSFESVLMMIPVHEIAKNIERDFKSRVSIRADVDAGILHVVCTEADMETIQLKIKDLRHAYEEMALTSTLPLEKLNPDKLEDDVSTTEPVLLNKFKVFLDEQTIRIIAKPDNLDLLRRTVDTILLWEEKKPELTIGIPKMTISLEREWFQLLKNPRVFEWIVKTMRPWGISVNIDKCVFVFSLIKESLNEGCKNFKSFFKEINYDTRKTENIKPEIIKEMLESFSSQLQGKLVVTIEKQHVVKVVCTSDVHDRIQTKLDDIVENCSNVIDRVEGCTLEDVLVIKRLFPEALQKFVDKNVQFREDKDGCLMITGKRPLVDKVRREVIDLKSRIVVEEKDCAEIHEVLKMQQGKDVVAKVEEAFSCLIRRPDDDDDDDDDDDISISEGFLPPEQYVRLTHWTSDCGSSITVVQGTVGEAQSDILAIPVVGGRLPHEVVTAAQRASGQEFETLTKMTRTLKDGKGKQFEDLGSTSWSASKRVVLFWMPPTLKEGKNQEKEKVRGIVKDVLMICSERAQISCSFVVHHLDTILRAGVKNIIRAVLEALKDCRNCFDIFLLSDNQANNDVIKILHRACPGSKKFDIRKITERFKRSKKGKPGSGEKTIIVKSGFLEDSKVDVIVNSTGTKLDLSKGKVSMSLNKKTNGKMQKELNVKYPNGIKHNEVAVSEGRDLRCEKVFHGALQQYPSEAERTKENIDLCLKGMEFFIYRCLKHATDARFETMAFPVLGTGNLQYPRENVAEVMFSSVEAFFEMNPSTTVKKVTFVIFPKDTDVYKVFLAEEMKRNYQDNGFIHSDSNQDNREYRVERSNVILQILENDIHKSKGMSDGLLCFWDEEQMGDPQSHPVVGNCLEAIKWAIYTRELKEKGIIKTEGGRLAKIIFHVVIKSNFGDALARVFQVILGQHIRTLQISIQDGVPKGTNIQGFFKHLLDEVHNSRGKSLCLISIVSSPQCFTLLVQEAERQGHGLVKQIKVFLDAVKSYAKSKGQLLQEDNQKPTEKQPTENAPKIRIFAKSSDDCKKAFDQLKQDIMKKRNEVTLVDSRDKDVHKEEFDSEDYSKVVPNLTLQVNQAIVESPSWVHAQTILTKLGMVSKDGRGHTIIEGSYNNMMKARDHLMRLHSNTPETKEDHLGVSKSQMDTKLEPPIEVTPAHYEALEYFLGEKSIREHCTIVNEKNMKRLHFICNEQNRQLVESLKMRAEGIMQGEFDFQNEASQVSPEKAASVPKDVMKNMQSVYMKYIPNNHSILIFSEDWDVMPKAKRMVKIHLGQVKTDRSKRRFKPESSTSKPETKGLSFVVESGCGIAEGEHITVIVYKKNITELTLDAIVNAANGQLHHGGGVARVIAAAAGDQLRAEGNQYVLKNGDIPVTELAVTTAGKLPCRMVFHAVGPEWDKYPDKKDCLEDLCCTILRCLCEAENRKLKTIAIPSISSAIFGVPQEECAKMYVRALRSFDVTVNQGSLREVHFVDVNQKMIQIITDEMSRNWMSQPDKVDVKRDSDFIKHCLHPGAASINYQNDKMDLSSKNKFKISEKLTLCIEKGDILKQEADAIALWENFTFTDGDRIIQQMIEEGGKMFHKARETAKREMREPYEVKVGQGGNLRQPHVLFAVVGQTAKIIDFNSLLKKMYDRCQSNGIRSIIVPVFENFEKVVGKSRFAVFIECILDTLKEFSKETNIDPLKVVIVDHQQHVVDTCTQILKEFSIAKVLDSGKNSDDNCPICLGDITDEEKLKCGHSFCKNCIDEAFKRKKTCPTCNAVCGVITGSMPKGSMTSTVNHYVHLPGYEQYSTIEINYTFLDGEQKENHPHPGQRYKGTSRTAYLPDSPEGREVLKLLKVAWERKLTFTLGRSVTIGDNLDRVTWNEIHHKTTKYGGATNHGYPDPGYLKRVKEELAAQGVTLDDLGATGTPV